MHVCTCHSSLCIITVYQRIHHHHHHHNHLHPSSFILHLSSSSSSSSSSIIIFTLNSPRRCFLCFELGFLTIRFKARLPCSEGHPTKPSAQGIHALGMCHTLVNPRKGWFDKWFNGFSWDITSSLGFDFSLYLKRVRSMKLYGMILNQNNQALPSCQAIPFRTVMDTKRHVRP